MTLFITVSGHAQKTIFQRNWSINEALLQQIVVISRYCFSLS